MPAPTTVDKREDRLARSPARRGDWPTNPRTDHLPTSGGRPETAAISRLYSTTLTRWLVFVTDRRGLMRTDAEKETHSPASDL